MALADRVAFVLLADGRAEASAVVQTQRGCQGRLFTVPADRHIAAKKSDKRQRHGFDRFEQICLTFVLHFRRGVPEPRQVHKPPCGSDHGVDSGES